VPSKIFKKELIIGAAVFFGGILIISAGLYFVSNDIAARVSAIVTERALINDRARTLGSLAGLKRDLPEAERYRAAINKLLISKDSVIGFPPWLSDVARARHVAVSLTWGADHDPQPGTLGFVGFSMNANGSSENLLGFLRDVEFHSSRFLVDLTSFDLVRTSGSEYGVISQGKVYFK